MVIWSSQLLWDDLEVHRGHHEVDDEEEHERDDHRLVHGVTDTLRATAGVQALVGGHDRRQGAEHECLELTDVQVGQLGEGGERREVGPRRTALKDDVEEVAAGYTDD